MSDELQLYADPNIYSGETVIARLFDAGIQIGDDINTTEVGTSGHFIADMPIGIEEGKYAVIFYNSLDGVIAQGIIEWDGNQELESGWKVNEIKQIRSVLGLSGDKITAVGGQIQDIKAKTDFIDWDDVARLLGLSRENMAILNTTPNPNGLPTSGTVKLYPSKADCLNDTNPIDDYSFMADYNANDELTSFKMVKN